MNIEISEDMKTVIDQFIQRGGSRLMKRLKPFHGFTLTAQTDDTDADINILFNYKNVGGINIQDPYSKKPVYEFWSTTKNPGHQEALLSLLMQGVRKSITLDDEHRLHLERIVSDASLLLSNVAPLSDEDISSRLGQLDEKTSKYGKSAIAYFHKGLIASLVPSHVSGKDVVQVRILSRGPDFNETLLGEARSDLDEADLYMQSSGISHDDLRKLISLALPALEVSADVEMRGYDALKEAELAEGLRNAGF